MKREHLLILIAVFFIGFGVARVSTPTKIEYKTKYRTPPACLALVKIDDAIFSKLGDEIGNFKDIESTTTGLSNITDYINSVSAERVDNANGCTNA